MDEKMTGKETIVNLRLARLAVEQLEREISSIKDEVLAKNKYHDEDGTLITDHKDDCLMGEADYLNYCKDVDHLLKLCGLKFDSETFDSVPKKLIELKRTLKKFEDAAIRFFLVQLPGFEREKLERGVNKSATVRQNVLSLIYKTKID